MSQPPEPVHEFFTRFLANPNAQALWTFHLDLLDLEISRAQKSLPDLPAGENAKAYEVDTARALRVQAVAQRRGWRDDTPFGPAWFWLALLGHRLAVERGLPTGGITALAEVASRRFNLPLAETRLWSHDILFEQYTRTVLRAEWDYPGLQCRRPAGV